MSLSKRFMPNSISPPGRWSLVILRRMLETSPNSMTLFLSTFAMSHWSHFSKRKFEILKNGNFFFNCSDIKGSPFWKKNFKIEFFSFLVTNHTFSIWIWNLHLLSFLLRCITWVLVKIFKFSLFYNRISIDNQVLSATSQD